jgi:hypothetical protein
MAGGKRRRHHGARPAAARPRGGSPKSGAARLARGVLDWLQLPLFAPQQRQTSRRQPKRATTPRAGTEVRIPGSVAVHVSEAAAWSLARRLAARLPAPLVELTLTENRTILLTTTRTAEGGLRLRLHRAFLEAGEDGLSAVIAFASGSRGKRRTEALAGLRAHVDAWRAAGNSAAPLPPIEPRGLFHDLRAIRTDLNLRMFGGRVAPAITWGRWANLNGRRRTIRLGSYDDSLRLIRIHPALDQPWVPRHFVAAVVYHEMLHAVLPAREGGGRRCLHGDEFRRRERLLPGHQAAEAWLEANLHRLLRSRPPRPGEEAPARGRRTEGSPSSARPLGPAARPRPRPSSRRSGR